MSAHTPGPWSVVDGHYPGFREIKGSSFTVSIVMSATNLDFMDYVKREADARVMAAAPELLEALQLCAAVYAGESLSKSLLIHALEKARAAITKATGSAA